MGLVGGALNLYFIYKFIRILTTPFASTDAFKLGIVDEKGKILKKKSKLKSIEEKEAYTIMHRLVWKLKRLMEKIPFGKSRLASYAAALWLIKEETNFNGTDEELQESFLSFLESDWKNEALILKENYEGDMDKKTFGNLRQEGIDIKKASMKDVIKDFQSSDAPQFKGKSDKKKKEMAIAAKLSTEEVEIDEGKFKKGDIVIPNIGPHKGEKHTIIHDFKNGSYNISLNKKHSKYDQGAAKAKEKQLKLVKEEVELDEKFAGWIAFYNRDKLEIKKNEADSLWDAKKLAIKHFKVPKSKQGLLAIEPAEEGYGGTKKWKKGQNKMKKAGVVLHKKDRASGYVEEVELDEKWEVGVVYHQEYKGGDRTYFRADSILKNTRWKGMSVDEIGGKLKKPKNNTADEKVMGWEITPKNEIPKSLKEEVELDEHCGVCGEQGIDEKLVSKLKIKPKKVKKLKDLRLYRGKPAKKPAKGHGSYSKYSDTSGGYSFMKSKGSSGYVGAYNSAELDGTEIKEDEVDEASLGSMISKKAKKLGKASSGYTLYHKDFSSAMQHAYDHAKKKGHIVDKKEIDDKVATGPKKPSKGKTNRYELKAGKRTVMIQVANLDNKRYELNMYIEGVELGEVESKYDKEIAAFKAKGGKVKKLKPGKKFKSLFKQKGPKKSARSEEVELEEAKRRMSGSVADYIKFAKGQGPDPDAVFDVTSVNKWAVEIRKGINAGWISVEPSALGGEYNVSIMIKLTLEKEKNWPHNILHNASFGMVRVDVDGGMEMFASGHKVKNMRKTKVKSARDVVSKINTWIKKVEEGFIPFSTFITEGRPKQDPDYVPGATVKDFNRTGLRALADAQKKHYSVRDIESIARKYKVKLPEAPVGGKTWDWDWEIVAGKGISLSYRYNLNSTFIKGWKFDKKKAETHLAKYGNEHETVRDMKGSGGKVQVIGLETAFELIEGFQLEEEAPANSVAGGNVNLDPFVKKKRKNAKVQTEMFGGQKVFVVSPQRYFDSRLGKSRYARYEKYVGNDKLGEAIRQYGRNNPKNSIILKNSGNGAMLYLKYGRK